MRSMSRCKTRPTEARVPNTDHALAELHFTGCHSETICILFSATIPFLRVTWNRSSIEDAPRLTAAGWRT